MEPSCNHEESLPENQTLQLPPGYRFHPTDDELILYYLQKQIDGHPLPIQIPQICLATTNPHTLSERYSKIGDEYWYFLTSRDRKYPNGNRPNRGAESGYWKATGSDKNVVMGRKVIGYKKTLVFYQGKPQSGKKTGWIMQEYRVNQLPRQKQTPTDMRLDDCVLCRIHKKTPKVNPKTEDDLDDGDGNDGDENGNDGDEKMNASHNIEEENHDHANINPDQGDGVGDENQNQNSFYYDNINIEDEDYLQDIFGVLGQGEPPSMEDILTPQQPQPFGPQPSVPVELQQPQPFGLGFDTSASFASSSSQNNCPFGLGFDTSASFASSSSQNNCPTFTNFSASASSSQNNFTNFSASASSSQNNSNSSASSTSSQNNCLMFTNFSVSSTSASSSQNNYMFTNPFYKGPTF